MHQPFATHFKIYASLQSNDSILAFEETAIWTAWPSTLLSWSNHSLVFNAPERLAATMTADVANCLSSCH